MSRILMLSHIFVKKSAREREGERERKNKRCNCLMRASQYILNITTVRINVSGSEKKKKRKKIFYIVNC